MYGDGQMIHFSKTEALFGWTVSTTGRRRNTGPWIEGRVYEGRVYAKAESIQAEL
jgi:hypothetical protein